MSTRMASDRPQAGRFHNALCDNPALHVSPDSATCRPARVRPWRLGMPLSPAVTCALSRIAVSRRPSWSACCKPVGQPRRPLTANTGTLCCAPTGPAGGAGTGMARGGPRGHLSGHRSGGGTSARGIAGRRTRPVRHGPGRHGHGHRRRRPRHRQRPRIGWGPRQSTGHPRRSQRPLLCVLPGSRLSRRPPPETAAPPQPAAFRSSCPSWPLVSAITAVETLGTLPNAPLWRIAAGQGASGLSDTRRVRLRRPSCQARPSVPGEAQA